MAKGKGTASFKATIQAYLDQRAATDKLFAASYAKADKNIDDCIGYIFAEVQKSGCNGFTDEEIYGMAVHYYDEEGEVKSPRNVSVVVNHQVELTEEEIAAAKARAIAQVEAEQRRQLQEKAAASAVPAAKPKKPQPKPQAAQLDLFSFMEGDSDEA